MQRLLRACLLTVFFICLSLPVSAAPQLDLSLYKGKVVYLDFWASWCVPCRHSFPWMNSMQAKYGNDGLVIIAVNLDAARADADRFLQQTPADFQILFDPDGVLAQQYDLLGMPSSFLIDRDGNVHSSHIGFREDSPAAYERDIQSLIHR